MYILQLVDLGDELCISDIKGKTAKIHNLTDKIDEDLDEIKTAVSTYQNKLKAAVTGIEDEQVLATIQVKSDMLNNSRRETKY